MKPTTKLALSVIIVGLLVAGGVVGFINGVTPREGLDLQGGISVVLEAPAGTPKNVLDLAVDNIRNRVDATGVAEAQISVVGDRDIQVEVPGGATGDTEFKNGTWCATTAEGRDLGCKFETESQALAAIQAVGQQDLLNTIGTTARLEEREVIGSASKDDLLTSCPPSLGGKHGDPRCNDPKVVKCPLNNVDAPGCSSKELSTADVVYLGLKSNPDTNVAEACTSIDGCPRYKMGPVQITGDAIKKAVAQPPDQNHTSWWVSFTLTGSGSALFGDVTTRLQGKQLAIILDKEVESAPTVQSPITNGSGEITGSFSETDARNLAKFLNYGALPVELQRQNVETISPTLGKKSLHQGLIAGIAGLILLMLYLAFYYRLLGIVTWFGMTIWAVFALSFISALGKWGPHYSLSLAGIAGIIVSMGITADSYIVFYERLKDEVRHGKTLRAAVQPAFKRAWRTIYTADVVTGLAAAVLYFVSVGSVRGFAFTLGIATMLDMGVVYFFKRPTVFLIARSPKLSNMRGIGLRSGVAADPDPIPVPVAGASE